MFCLSNLKHFRYPYLVQTDAEAFLNISYHLKKGTDLVPAGFMVAEDQLFLGGSHKNILDVNALGKMTIKDEAQFIPCLQLRLRSVLTRKQDF